MRELHAIVSGKVQGVSFRDFVFACAAELSLKGYVRNLPNGTVRVMAQGDDTELHKLLEKLREGPTLSQVLGVKAEWWEVSDIYPTFQIEY